MALKLRDLGFQKVYALKGGYRDWTLGNHAIEKKWTVKAECVECHKNVTPGIVADWEGSKHAEFEVTCSVCHGEHHMSEEDVEQVPRMKPDRCAMCHQVQGDQFRKGKHALAWDSMKTMPTAHWQPMALTEGMKGCGGCHKIGLKTEQEMKRLVENGTGFGYASCDACHTRHSFSLKEAGQPQACRTCHMGFDHPHWEMYSSSKHGVRHELRQIGVLHETAAAPTCQTCHMQEGNHEVRAAWGFLAVRLPMPKDKKWAEARATVLKALGVLDPEGSPTARLDAVKQIDLARIAEDAWRKERDKMTGSCTGCHSVSFVQGELAKGDDMIREADLVMAEAIDIVAGLFRDGILKKPKSYTYAYPDLLSFHDAPTVVEQKLFVMFFEQRARTFQGTFHANPDYALWYGWSAMRQSLTEIKELAETMRRQKQ